MKNYMKLIIGFASFAALSCSKADDSAISSHGDGIFGHGHSRNALFSGSEPPEAFIFAYSSLDSTRTGASRYGQIDASFSHPDSVQPVSAGTVTFNTTPVPSLPGGEEGTTYSTAHALGSVPISFDGSPHAVAISGSSAFPAINISEQAPNGATSITSPGITETLSKATGFTIQWEGGGSDTVEIALLGGGANAVWHSYTSDNGSITITPGMLEKFSPGPIDITVTRVNYRLDSAAGRRYFFAIGSSMSIESTLQD